jgi:hypothetical protein
VCVSCPFISSTGRVSAEHLPRPPAGEPHEVLLSPSGCEPLVSELVTEAVRVQAVYACLVTPSLHHLSDTAVSHRTPTTQPQRVCGWRQGMLGTSPDVAAECFPGAVAEGCGTLAPSLAQDERHILVEVQVLKRDPDKFSDPEAGVQEEAEDRRIPSLLEPAALAGIEHSGDFVSSQKRYRLLGHCRRAHLDEGGLRDLFLVLQPAEQLLQGAVVPCHGRGRDHLVRGAVMVTRGKVKEVVLHVPSADVTNERGTTLTEEERPEGRPDLEVGVDGSWRAVTPAEVASPVRQKLAKIIR